MKVKLSPPTMSQATQALGYNMGLQRLLAESRAAVKKLMERRTPLKEVLRCYYYYLDLFQSSF